MVIETMAQNLNKIRLVLFCLKKLSQFVSQLNLNKRGGPEHSLLNNSLHSSDQESITENNGVTFPGKTH